MKSNNALCSPKPAMIISNDKRGGENLRTVLLIVLLPKLIQLPG